MASSLLSGASKLAGVVGGAGGAVTFFMYWNARIHARRSAAARIEDELGSPRLMLLAYLLDPSHDDEEHTVDMARISPFAGQVSVRLRSDTFARLRSHATAAQSSHPPHTPSTITRVDSSQPGTDATALLNVYRFALAGLVEVSTHVSEDMDKGTLTPTDVHAYTSFIHNWLLPPTAPQEGSASPNRAVVQYIVEGAATERFPRLARVLALWQTLGLDVSHLVHDRPSSSASDRRSPADAHTHTHTTLPPTA